MSAKLVPVSGIASMDWQCNPCISRIGGGCPHYLCTSLLLL